MEVFYSFTVCHQLAADDLRAHLLSLRLSNLLYYNSLVFDYEDCWDSFRDIGGVDQVL